MLTDPRDRFRFPAALSFRRYPRLLIVRGRAEIVLLIMVNRMGPQAIRLRNS
jgi:hypothetical protein